VEALKSIELFSGAGGLALGLALAGFKHVMLVERDDYCCDTLEENKSRGLEHVRDWKVIHEGISAVDFTKYSNRVELVAGGPPCQPFSVGGKARGFNDARDLFPEAIDIVARIRPKAFLFENVRGLLRPAFGNYVEYLRLRMEFPSFPISKNAGWEVNLQRLQRHATSGGACEPEYQVFIHAVNAADYGVPQKRFRVFFVGFRTDLDVRWFFPKPTHSEERLIYEKYITGAYWDRNEVSRKERTKLCNPEQTARIGKLEREWASRSAEKPWATVREALAGLPDPRTDKDRRFCNHIFQPGARSYVGHTGSPLDEPAKALKAGDHGVPGGENMIRFPDHDVRYFTVRESARLQTFPDQFLFHGNWSETMRQLGNAVPVELAKLVGRSVKEALLRTAEQSSVQKS
jgi:DNA (cytosine-5)-methyltransferase 1